VLADLGARDIRRGIDQQGQISCLERGG